MKRRGRPFRGALSGLLFGGFLGADLFVFGVVPLDSAVLTLAPVLGLAVGLVLGFTAPFGTAAPPTAAVAAAGGLAADAETDDEGASEPT